MRYLVIGLGSIGRRHLRNLKALGENDFVLLRSGRSTLPDDDLQGIPVVSDLRQALEAILMRRSYAPRRRCTSRPPSLPRAQAFIS